MSSRIHVAEEVLPGHPDRLADTIAELIVDAAVACYPPALVGVEVAVHRSHVFVTGRVAVERGEFDLRLDSILSEAQARAGYRGNWALDQQLVCDLDLTPLDDDEREIRRFSDDQSVCVGHAVGGDGTAWLPPAPFAARILARKLLEARVAREDVLGPDGKLLVVMSEDGGRFSWEEICVSIQHQERADFELLHRLVLPALEAGAKKLDDALPGLGHSWRSRIVRLNGIGDFSCGGPWGDNGLSGKKLAVDHYGPGLPIGGGALCGKDPQKVDRVGALRARQLALRLARALGSRCAMARLVWMPGLERPVRVDLEADGEPVDLARPPLNLPDLSIAASVRALDLRSVRWADVLARGYFGNDYAWER